MTPVIIGMRHRIGAGAPSGHKRRALLEDNTLTWTGIIREVASRLSATHLIQQMGALQQDPHAAQQWLSDAHLLVIGCRQVDRHLKFLQKLGFRTSRMEQAAKGFLGAYNTTDLKDLRDLLEHQADYIAGQGRNSKLAIDLTLPVVFAAEAVRFGARGGRVSNPWRWDLLLQFFAVVL